MRHGETDWNTELRLQGTTDIPLNQNGIDLAKLTAREMHLQNIHFDTIYSSPLIRANVTAQLMNEYSNAPLILDDRIKEFCFGQAEGVTMAELKTNPKFSNLKNWFLKPESYIAELGAESYQEFFSRVDSFLNSLKQLPDTNQNILIVCHGGMVRGLMKQMCNWDINQFASTKIPNCGINLVTLTNGKFQLEYSARTFYTIDESISNYK